MVEEVVGIRGYITRAPGMGGVVKKESEDFVVTEVADVPVAEDGDHVILRVRKRNWDTLHFVRVLSNVLGISQKRISFAGTKDKRALTTQYFSIRLPDGDERFRVLKKLSELKLKDAEIEILGFSRRSLKLGDLLGNDFRVRVRGCEDGGVAENVKEELAEKGVPNFFGLQRFGTVRFITHEVGKLILQRRYEDAFWVYVAKPFESEREDVKEVRKTLWETRDAKLGLKEMPGHLRYERTLLQKLREGKDEKEALLSLPKNLKMMFVHAYQSYIFNRLLSDRIEEFGSLKIVDEGDWACYITKSKVKPTFVDCSTVGKNVSRVRFLVERRFASLALPLVGYRTELKGWSRRAKEYLDEDGIAISDFKGEFKEFSSSGSYRAADMIFEITGFEFSSSDGDAIFEFYLPRGCYATVFLREFLKVELS